VTIWRSCGRFDISRDQCAKWLLFRDFISEYPQAFLGKKARQKREDILGDGRRAEN